ncbi:MAG: 5-formyltetrahydrofolate cyclo-ligase [Phycisphaeraceae bacterium]
MTEPTHDNKKSLRAELRAMLRCVPPEQLHIASAAACALLGETAEFERAACVMIFWPLSYEMDARPLAMHAWQRGKTVALPRVSYEQRHMMAVEIRSLGDSMQADQHGVNSPINAPPIPTRMIDLVIVPGLGFDLTGHRLGRGGGFYDRFLSRRNFRGLTCGLALEQQVVEHIPTQPHDVRLDMLATERRILRFGEGGEEGLGARG